jgi:ketosteroid isomerase-like protein
MINHFIVMALALSITTASAIAQDNPDIERIRTARAEYNDAIARHDVTGIVSFLDEAYQVTTSLGQLLQDRDGEAAAWQDLIESREDLLYVRSPESIEISSDYPLAAELGTWVGTWSTNQGEVRTGGRYAAMWRQVDGAWKVRSELFVALYCDGANCPRVTE